MVQLGAGTWMERSMLQSETSQFTDAHDEQLESNPQLKMLRKKGFVAYQDGILYVAETYATDSGVDSFTAYCKRKGVIFKKELVGIEKINRLNSRLETGSDSVNSQAIQTFHEITRHCVNAHASDIHIIVSNINTIIKQRVHGDLVAMPSNSLTTEDGENLCRVIYQSMTGEDTTDTHYTPSRQQDASIPSANLHTTLRGSVNGIRVASSPIRDGSLMVLRILYETGHGEVGSLINLGYTPMQVDVIERMKRYSTGLNLVVGPTGSGKSTTLKIVLENLNKDYEGRIHILTVEDPPEYPMPGINQIPVTNADSTEDRLTAFNNIVRGAMRLDPDCMMIGEIRDAVTAQLSLNAAMTGHRVWTTLHANTAIGAVQRLSLLNVDMSLLTEPSVFRGVCSQRLVKVLCQNCKIPYVKVMADKNLTSTLRKSGLASRLDPIIDGYEDDVCFKGEGCRKCSYSGTIGRTVIAEIFENTYHNSKTMNLMIEKKWPEARAEWLASGGTTMMMSAIEKIQQGIVDPRSIEDVLDPLYIEKV